MFWIEFDMIFAFLDMQVIAIVFSIVLDFITTFFCMQQIILVFWIDLDIIFAFFLHAGYYNSVLDCVGLDLHLRLHASCSYLPEKQ